MAVLLYREGERKGQALSPEVRSLPRVTVRNQPVNAAPHWSGGVRARTPTHVSYTRPEREHVWRETFERRQVQQSACGFHGPPYRPYQDVGQVELDDPSLILGGLGQKQDGQLSLSPPPPPPSSHLQPVPSPPPRPNLRSMAPQLPDHLALLPVEMIEVEGRREDVKVGKGLFETLSKKERAKVKDAAKKERDNKAEKTAWQAGNVTFDPSRLASRRMSTQMESRPSTVTFDPITSSHDNVKTSNQSDKRGSHVTLDFGYHDNTTSANMERRKSAVTFADPLSGNHDYQQTSARNERPLTSGSSNSKLTLAGEISEEEQRGAEEEMEEGVIGESGEEGEWEEGEFGEAKGALSQQSELVHQWYRHLCVLVWVMDGLRLDSISQLTPFAKCWQINRAGVQAAHSLALSRNISPSSTHQTYTHWQRTAFSMDSPKYNVEFNPHDPRPDGHMTSPSHTHHSSKYLRQRREAASREEQRMRMQKKLTSSQMEALMKTLEEELDFSKKANRVKIERLLQRAHQAKKVSSTPSPPPSSPSPQPALDVGRVQEQFSEIEQTKTMTVHHQLSAMDRDRVKALEQRLVSLKAQHTLWRDLSLMRQGVEIESTCMARKKLLMNFQWFPDLLSQLPDAVKADRYCQRLLELLSAHSQHSAQVGPDQWSKRKLISILSTLRPWELQSPETSAAIEFLIRHVIYILPEDYQQWMQYHTHCCSTTETPC